MLDQLGLSHVKQPFRDNGVNGRVLAILDETVRMRSCAALVVALHTAGYCGCCTARVSLSQVLPGVPLGSLSKAPMSRDCHTAVVLCGLLAAFDVALIATIHTSVHQ